MSANLRFDGYMEHLAVGLGHQDGTRGLRATVPG